MEYEIEKIKIGITLIVKEKRFLACFKFKDSHWCRALPLKRMYLQTLDGVIKDIERMKKDPINKDCEYKILEIEN